MSGWCGYLARTRGPPACQPATLITASRLGLTAASRYSTGTKTGDDHVVLRFQKDGNTLMVSEPNSAVDYMELRDRLVEMGIIWSFPPK